MLSTIKNILPNAPRPIGELIALIPFSMRCGWGRNYQSSLRNIMFFERASIEEKRNFIFERVRFVVQYALEHVPFYQKYYADMGFSIGDLNSFEDICTIPVISKNILQNYEIEDRSSDIKRGLITYTGGSTGEPFNFYSDPLQIGNEWAHIHYVWSKIGYRQGDLLLTVALEPNKQPVFYDALRHSLVLNIHHSYDVLAKKFAAIPLKKRRVVFFRGYPSAWAELLSFFETSNWEIVEDLKRTLKGSLLASEFPFPHFRNTIERITQRRTISWYGLSERAILAWEKNRPFLYEPLQSYGLCESITDPDGFSSLVGTTYWNFAFPFIRYRTDDGIKIIDEEDGFLHSFEIVDGRVGDYLFDRDGKKFSITHLNLSCRESTWAIARCVQVEQSKPGSAILWITPRRKVTIDQAKEAFDFKKLNIDFEYKIIERPITSSRGKVLLKIPANLSPRRLE